MTGVAAALRACASQRRGAIGRGESGGANAPFLDEQTRNLSRLRVLYASEPIAEILAFQDPPASAQGCPLCVRAVWAAGWGGARGGGVGKAG